MIACNKWYLHEYSDQFHDNSLVFLLCFYFLFVTKEKYYFKNKLSYKDYIYIIFLITLHELEIAKPIIAKCQNHVKHSFLFYLNNYF